MIRRLVMTLFVFVSLPASAREVLVLTTATQMNSLLNDPGLELQNRGPASIFCEVSVNGSGLTTITGREIKPAGIWFSKRPVGRNVYCISTTNQLTTAATNVSERAEYAFSDSGGSSGDIIARCNGTPGTPLVLTITGGADANVTLLKGTRYLATNDAGGTVFCKAGGAATNQVDAPYLDQSTRCHQYSPLSGADVVYHCAAAAAVTGKIYFTPMTGVGP